MEFEKDGWLFLGKSQISVAYLKSVTLEVAIKELVSEALPESRVRNAWKRANKKK